MARRQAAATNRNKIVYGPACSMPGACKHGSNNNWRSDSRGEWLCGCPEYPGQIVEERLSEIQKLRLAGKF